MRLKRFSARLAAVMLAGSMALTAGCGMRQDREDAASAVTNTEQAADEEILASGTGEEEKEVAVETDAFAEDPDSLGGLKVIMGSFSIPDCVSIRDMENVDLGYSGYREPTYEDARLSVLLKSAAVPVSDYDFWAEDGDLVKADIIAYIDGEQDENISRMSEDIRIGAGSEEKEIEEHLKELQPKQETEFDKTYSEDDNYLGLAGKTVHYRIRLISIARPEEPDETTVMRELHEMEQAAEEAGEDNRYEHIWEQILARTEVYAYPEAVVRQARAEYEEKNLRGELLEDYLNRTGITRAEFKKIEDEYAIEKAKEKLAIIFLQDMTGIDKDSSEYKRKRAATEYNPEDPDAVMRMTLIDALSDVES